jgi:hypothetical protein
MKRSDIQVGQELAYSRDNDWQSSPYRIQKVTVADTRGFFARRYNAREAAPIELQDGTTTPGSYYAVDSSKPTCLVRRENGDLILVPLAQLRGVYADCEAVCIATAQARAKSQAALRDHQAQARARVATAAEALKAMGVELGYVSQYAEKLELGPKALEQILALLVQD